MLGASSASFRGALIFQLSVVAHGFDGTHGVSIRREHDGHGSGHRGISAAMLVPTLVVLIAFNYRDWQRTQALGILASIPPSRAGWRRRRRPSPPPLAGASVRASCVPFDRVLIMASGPPTCGIGIRLTSSASCFGDGNCIHSVWLQQPQQLGMLWATPNAPFSGLIVAGADVDPSGHRTGSRFFAWSHQRVALKKTPLLALEVLDSPEEQSAVVAFLVAGALGTAVSFLIPLYIQFVQDRTPLFTAVAIVPYALAVAAAAIVSVRLYDRLTPQARHRFIRVDRNRPQRRCLHRQQRLGHACRHPRAACGRQVKAPSDAVDQYSCRHRPELAGDGRIAWRGEQCSSALGARLPALWLWAGLLITTSQSVIFRAPLVTEINLDKLSPVGNNQLEAVLARHPPPLSVDAAVRISEAARRLVKTTFL
jgi:hypothetical protein